MKPLEIYIHIPFCVKKCRYCDFLSAPSSREERDVYVEELCRRIRAHADKSEIYRIVSIFIGGGTPSLLSEGQIKKIFAALRETFLIEKDAEITIEMNPGTVTQEKLAAYREAGINRLSIGLQSADDTELRALGRIHTFEEFLHTYRLAREAGFCNMNADLMSAVPFQTAESWEKTLRTVAGLLPAPEHISAYSLIIEEGTPFYERYRRGPEAEELCRKELPSEDEERKMYEDTKRILAEYGYHRYEISNYARPGYECRHNLGYWDRVEYLGIGTGAASFMNETRWIQGEKPEHLTVAEQMSEYMFLGLRKTKGVSKKKFLFLYGRKMEEVYGPALQDMEEKGLLVQDGDFVRLTERGIDISNYVMSEFLPE